MESPSPALKVSNLINQNYQNYRHLQLQILKFEDPFETIIDKKNLESSSSNLINQNYQDYRHLQFRILKFEDPFETIIDKKNLESPSPLKLSNLITQKNYRNYPAFEFFYF